MLRAFMKQHDTREWVRALQFVTFAANTSRHRTTGMTPFLLHRGREPPMGRLFRGSLDRAFERGSELPEELSLALLEAPSDEAAGAQAQAQSQAQEFSDGEQRAAHDRNREAARRIGRQADAMVARAREMNRRVQGREPIRVGDIVRVALDRLSKQYRQREKSRLGLHETQDPFRIRGHYSTDVFTVRAIERRGEAVQQDDGGGDEYRYRLRETHLDEAGSVKRATAGATLRRRFSRADLLRIPQGYVLGRDADEHERALCVKGASDDEQPWCFQDGYFRAAHTAADETPALSPSMPDESPSPPRRALRPRQPSAGPETQRRRPAALLGKHVCLPRSVWESLGVDHDLPADKPVCGFVVKMKPMATGRFYEFFVDDARLCVNVKAAIVERHAIVLGDGLTWPRGKRCRTLPQRRGRRRGD